jgi:hypothetical protein
MVAGEESEDDDSQPSEVEEEDGRRGGAGAAAGAGDVGGAHSDGSDDGNDDDGDDDDDAGELDLEFLKFKGAPSNRGVLRMADGVMTAIKPPLHHIALRLVELQEAQQVGADSWLPAPFFPVCKHAFVDS